MPRFEKRYIGDIYAIIGTDYVVNTTKDCIQISKSMWKGTPILRPVIEDQKEDTELGDLYEIEKYEMNF